MKTARCDDERPGCKERWQWHALPAEQVLQTSHSEFGPMEIVLGDRSRGMLWAVGKAIPPADGKCRRFVFQHQHLWNRLVHLLILSSKILSGTEATSLSVCRSSTAQCNRRKSRRRHLGGETRPANCKLKTPSKVKGDCWTVSALCSMYLAGWLTCCIRCYSLVHVYLRH